MIDLKYFLVIEATDDPTFFGFYSRDLEGFTGIGHSGRTPGIDSSCPAEHGTLSKGFHVSVDSS